MMRNGRKSDLMRYIAIEIINFGSKNSRREIIGIGDQLDREAAVALRTKIQRRMQKLHGTGASYKSRMRYIDFVTVEYAMLHYRELRERLRPYNNEYYSKLIAREENKRKRQASRKIGVKFIDYETD
jgi:hypothetical protein